MYGCLYFVLRADDVPKSLHNIIAFIILTNVKKVFELLEQSQLYLVLDQFLCIMIFVKAFVFPGRYSFAETEIEFDRFGEKCIAPTSDEWRKQFAILEKIMRQASLLEQFACP
jgi:hypothetical protein